MEKLHYRFRVVGKVQGVWFRKYTCDYAESIQLVGFVENKNDLSVYIEAEGNRQQLKLLETWLYQGSPNSRVDRVDKIEGQLKNFKQFNIKH